MTTALVSPNRLAGDGRSPQSVAESGGPELSDRWLRLQGINLSRHSAALRPFLQSEFGPGVAAPSEGHLQAANRLMALLRRKLWNVQVRALQSVAAARRNPSTRQLQDVTKHKESAHALVQAVEKIWDFYFELFGQRQSAFGQWLLGCDRIALDCYQAAYLGLGKAKSIPAPPPFCYMRTGFSPATYRRGIRLTRLGKQINPFPLIQIPYHRLVNPWALGAILHEVSHNLQNELGLADAIPLTVGRELFRAGLPRLVASTWQRWNRETFADIAGLLLGGPGVAGSLMDVIGRAPKTVVTFVPDAPHPTPWLRMLITLELLKRMGFARQAEEYRRLWLTMYPDPYAGTIPRALVETAQVAIPKVVSIMAFRRWPSLGDKALAEVIRFGPKEQSMVEETAHRLARGNDPGIVPERFLIGAARFAVDRKLAPAETIQRNFYKELARR